MDSLMDPLREDKSNYTLAKETVEIIISIIKVKENLLEIINLIQELKKTLKERHQFKFTISNVIRKTLIIMIERSLVNGFDISVHKKLMQEKNLLQKKASSVNFSNEVMGVIQVLEEGNEEIANKMKKIKKEILNDLALFHDEFEQVSESINKYANSHINSKEVIMTFEYSTTILNFLLEAHKTRKFEVVVVDSVIEKSGVLMANKLAESNIPTALIPECAIFAMMSKVSKILIGSNAIMNNGGSLCISGGILVAMAAKEYSVPLLILSPVFKLTPKFPLDQATYNELLNPAKIFGMEHELRQKSDVLVDKYNYIAPEFISLYVTDRGEYAPEHIYRLFQEYYGWQEVPLKPDGMSYYNKDDLAKMLKKLRIGAK